MRERPPIKEMFDAQFLPEPNSGCWLWMSHVGNRGYAQMYVGGRRRYRAAHRVGWEVYRGPIPEGLVLDHMCRTRSCVNPDHLRVVTNRTNVLENSESLVAAHAAKKQCPKCGGPYTMEKVGRPRLARRCRPCTNTLARLRYHGQWEESQ